MAIIDCLVVGKLNESLEVNLETTFTIATIMAKHEHRVDVTAMVNSTHQISGVCEVKLPGFDTSKMY